MKNIILLILFSNALTVFADSNESLNFSYITKNEGLSDNNVECIFKDSDGFMWFGTRNGLCRFDGYEIKVYRKNENENSISGNRILDIIEDNNGYLWIGTYKDGLNRFNKQTEKFEHYGLQQGIGQRINRIKLFSDSSIWVGSNIGVIRLVNWGDTVRIIPFNDNSNYLSTYDMLETRNREVYIATDNQVIQKLNKNTLKFETIEYKRIPELSSNYRKRIIEDNNGLIWITASYHGLCSYDPKTGESEIFTAENNNLSTNVLMGSMDIDGDGNIWICTEEDGINIFNTESKTFKHLKNNPEQQGSLNSNHTYSVYFDDNERVWIGTFDKGINVYNPYQKKFSSSLFEPNDLTILSGSSVLDIFEDSKSRIWVGTDGNGLFCFEKTNAPLHYKKADESDVLTSNIVTALGEDPLGNILIGTYTGGLIAFNKESEKITKYYSDFDRKQLSSPHVWEIFTDSKNRIWLGLLAFGVDLFDYRDGSFINYGPYSNQKNKIDFYNVMVIDEDKDGDVWFGTEGKGIYLLNDKTGTVFRIKNDSISNFATEGIIKCLTHDKWGNMWIGTEDHGLFKYEKNKGAFTRFNKENGFISSPIQSIKEDKNGNLWIGTSSGLFTYNSQTAEFNRFIIEDGLSSNDFNPDAMIMLNDGRIIAGTNNGADIVIGENIQLNQDLPHLVFTKLSILNKEILPNIPFHERVVLTKSITYTNELVLTWKDKAFTLEFAALNYTLPEKCLYKYKLEGFDDDWVHTNADRRIVNYSNLAAGVYTLKILASNNDGKWGENELVLKIVVKPPFWNTLVFKLLIALLLALLIYYSYKQRIKAHEKRFIQKQLEQERKIIALENENLEAELKKLAFSIISKNKLLVEQKNRILNLSNKARESVKEGMQKIVDYIDDELDEEKDWNFIEPQIDKAYNHFITRLKENHPDLNSNEIRIAAYIRMNLSTKEICEFMNKTQRAVENDRYRLRKKIGLESNDNIKAYLENL